MELPALSDQREAAGIDIGSGPGALVANVVQESRRTGYDAGRTAGHAEGFAFGYEEGIAAAAVELESIRANAAAEREQQRLALLDATRAIDGAVAQIGPEGSDLYAALQRQLATAAVTLAEAILGRELRDVESRGVDAIERVLALAPERVPVTVRLHPSDADLIATTSDGFDDRAITLVPDPSLAPGDAVAELVDTEIDGRIAAAIERVRAAMIPDADQ